MLISELIAALEKLKSENGNIAVVTSGDFYEVPDPSVSTDGAEDSDDIVLVPPGVPFVVL